MKEVLKELFSLQTLQGAQTPNFGLNAAWQGESCSPRKDHSVQHCYTAWTQNCLYSQLFGAGPTFELVLDNNDHSGLLATNLDHKRHPESTSNNQSSSASLKALLGYLKYIEVSSWG